MMLDILKWFHPKEDYKSLVLGGALILDVRTVGEFMAGHIPGSLNVPVDQLGSVLEELRKKNCIIITCCRSGLRSGEAARLLQEAGLEAYNGGAWNVLIRKI